MRNKLLLLLLLLLPAWVAWAQAPVWQSVSGITGGATAVRGSALAANGDYYIVGSYTGSADFGNGKSLTSSDQTTTDGFLARINGTTNLCTWVVSMGGTTGGDEVRGVAVNGSTVYITGYYSGSASFSNTSNAGSQPLTAVVNPSTSTGSIDVFVAKYDENGNPLGSISGGGTSSDQGFSIAVNGTTIYITGFISTNTTTSTNVRFGAVALGNSGGQDMFVARFTDNGTLAHGGALSGGGTGLDRGNAIGVGTNGIYVAGYFTAATNATASISNSTLTGAGSNDIYIAKFTDTGSGLNNGGAVRSGGAFSDQATALTVSGTNIYVGGFFNQNATPGTPATVSISGSPLSSDNRDLFLAKYTDSGAGLGNGYAIRDGSANPESVGDLALSGSTVYVVGGYTTAATIAGSSLTSNSDAAYVAKYTDTGATFSAVGAIDGGPDASVAATAASTVSVSGNLVVLGGFLGSPATFTPASTGSITVPAGNSGFFAKLAQAPVLASISPNIGPVGTSVTLTGTNLTGTTVVTFNGTSNNTVTSVTVNGTGTQTITVNVPTGATTGNVTVTTPAGTSNGVAFTVQQPTTVASIVRASANPTNSTTVNYTVTFGAPVTGLTAANFTLTATGSISGATVGTPVNTGTGSTWTVPVTTGTGSGTLTLNLANATNLSPGISTALPFAGETYTIDKTAPTATITSSTGASGSTSSAATFAYTVTFSEAVTGFVAGDVTVTNGTIGAVSGSGTTYTFNVTPTANGAVTVNVPANVAQDAAGNGNTAASQYSITYAAPTTTVASVTRLTPSPTATTQVRYQVVFASSVMGLTVGNFNVTTTGSVSGTNVSSVSGSGTTYTVVVNTGTGDGTLRLDVANSANTSPTITNVPYTVGEVYTITKIFAAAPTLRIQAVGSASGNSDVTAFVDVVQVVQNGTSAVVANGLQNGSFETNNVSPSSFLYQSQGVVASPWSFGVQAGVSRNNSAFGSTAADGDAVALLQSIPGNNGSVTQNLAVPTGSYQIRFRAIQRNYTSLDQRLNVFVNDVFVGTIQPNNIPTYDTFTSATFSVTAPALTATISSTAGASGSTTATSPIPFTVTFSANVTGFSASDVAVTGGTVSGFSGSGTTYTFNVTPSASGTVTVNVPANSAFDGNNTGNAAATEYSLSYQQAITAAPVVTTPANGSLLNTRTPIYSGTAVVGSTVTVFVDGTSIGTTTATGGNFSLAQPANLADGSHAVYATAQASGSTVSANSNTNTFTIDATQPIVAISSTAGTSGGSTGTTPIPFLVTFSETVNGSFVQGDLTVSGGTIVSGSFSGSGAGPYTFTVTPSGIGSTVSVTVPANVAQDAAGNFNTAAPAPYTLRYAPALTATVSTTSSSPTSTAPIPFSVTFSQSVGTTFTASDVTVAGGTVTSGSFSGSGAGPYTFTVTPSGAGNVTVSLAANVAQDANNTGNSASNSVSVQYQAPTIVVGPASLPIGTQNTAYSQNLSASGGSGTYTFAITARALPPGLTLTSAGVLSGTPTTSGTFNFTITATDASAAPGPYSGSRDYSLVINAQPVTAAPVVTTPANNSSSNNRSVTVTGTAPAGSTVSIYIGRNLAGTTTASATGAFSYVIPSNAPDGTYVVTATAQSSGSAVSASSNGNTFTIDGTAPTAALSSTTVASGASTSTSPVSFTATFNEQVTGFTSSGITVTNGTVTSGPTAGSGNTYTFQVTPSGAGSVTVTVRASAAQDQAGNNNTASSPYAFTFVVSTIVVGPASLPIGTQNTAYSQNLSASGGSGTYTFAITARALPPGLTLTSAGVLSGTPTTSGTFNFTITATDASAAPGPYSGSRDYSLVINAQPVTATPVVTTPANGALVSTTTPTYSGTAPAGATVTVFVDNLSLGTTTAPNGSWTLVQPTALSQGSHTVYATAQLSGQAVSASSSTNTFTVDTVSPTVTLGSTATNPTTTSPIPVTATFSESVTGFGASSVTVTNGTLAGFSGSGSLYTFNVTPLAAGTVTVNIAANVTQDAAGNGNVAAPQFSITYVVPVTATTWTGTVSTDWFTAGNWTAGVPTATVDATIPTSPSGNRFPALTAGTANARNLTLNSGASLTHIGGTLVLAANLTNNGTFQPTGGTVVLGNTTQSNILGSSTIRFWNLTVQANGAQLSTSAGASVQRVLNLTSNLTTNGNTFTLLSSSTGDALVVNNGGVVVGTATVQRYIDPSLNAGLGARHYSAPVSNTTVADLATSGYTPVLNSAFNTADKPAQVRPFPTVFGYDQSRLTLVNTLPTFDKGFFSPTSFSDPLRVGQGYVVNIASTELVDFVGTLNNGDITTTMASNRDTYTNDGGWQLVGNPYPAPLDYGQVSDADRAGLDASLYVYSSTSQYNGQYRAYVRGVGGNSVVPSGQGFFVRVSSGRTTGSLTLRNAYRLTAPNATTFQRTTAETRPLVQLTLKGASNTSDDAYVYFENGATNALDAQYDAVKLPNTTGLNLSTSISGQQLAIDGRPELSKVQQVVPLAVGVPTVGTYTFTTAQLLNLANVPVYLRDLQLGTITDLRLTPSYQFTVTNASALITGRFELVFSPQQALATVPAALAQQVALYPNPAKKAAFVELPASLGRQAVTATFVDALGRQVRTVQLPAQGSVAHPLDLSDLATGVYALRLSTSAGVVVKKLVVE